MEIDGRRIYIANGKKTQTVNVCTAANERGEYDYVFRLPQSAAISSDDLLDRSSLEDLREWLIRRGARQELAPGRPRVPSPRDPAPRPMPQHSSPTRQDARREVFVVHGRDTRARDAVFRFLRSIDLKPMEWEALAARTGKSAPYIGEVLSLAFELAQAVVVILTPDDEARLRREFWRPDDPAFESELTGQARPNVLFEAGTALATHPDRTVIVEIGKLRPWSDIGGRHVVRVNGHAHELHALARRLEAAGCPVDISGSEWLDTRPFLDLGRSSSAG